MLLVWPSIELHQPPSRYKSPSELTLLASQTEKIRFKQLGISKLQLLPQRFWLLEDKFPATTAKRTTGLTQTKTTANIFVASLLPPPKSYVIVT